MADFSNIPGGLNIPAQIPLDPRKTRVDEATLAYLGIADNLAYTYYEQMEVICIEEATRWVWREVGLGEENTGLCPVDFTYPSAQATYGVDYSDRVFNFFSLSIAGPQGTQGIQGVAGTAGSVWRHGTGVPSNGTGVNGDYYLEIVTGDVYFRAAGTYSVVANIKGPTGNAGADGTTTIIDTSSIIVTGETPYELETVNQQEVKTTSFTLTNLHDKKTIYLNNDAVNITITVPTGLQNNFYAIFYQEGTGDVTFAASGTTIRYPAALGLLMKGQDYWACIEKKTNTETFNLSGSIKP